MTVCYAGNPQKIYIYALLDNQSYPCFIDQSLADELNSPSEKVHLKLTTMSDKQAVLCDLVSGLTIKGVNEDSEIELPGTYTQEYIPFDKDIFP